MDPLALALGATAGTAATWWFNRTRDYRRDDLGLADLLPYDTCVAEGVVRLLDGALLCGFTYDGPDHGMTSRQERQALSASMDGVFRSLRSGWMIQHDVDRSWTRKARPQNRFPDPVSDAIDGERRRRFAPERALRTRYTLLLTFFPTPRSQDVMSRVFIRGQDLSSLEGRRLLAFEAVVSDVYRRLLSAGLRCERLTSNGLLSHIYEAITGDDRGVIDPGPGVLLADYLSVGDAFPRLKPMVANRHLRVLTVHDFPVSPDPRAPGRRVTYPGLLNALHNETTGGVAHPYRWSTRTIPLSAEQAAPFIRARRFAWWKKIGGMMGFFRQLFGFEQDDTSEQRWQEVFEDNSARVMARDANEAFVALTGANEHYAAYTTALVVADANVDTVERRVVDLLVRIRETGVPARIEDLNAFEAWLGSLPGVGSANPRRYIVKTRNASDLVPLSKTWLGPSHNQSDLFPADTSPLLTARTGGDAAFNVHLHPVDDLGNTLVVGSPGSGKSVLAATLAANWLRYKDGQVFTFDFGYAFQLVTRALGGAYYDYGSERAGLTGQPLAYIDEPEELAWAQGWSETLFEHLGVDMDVSRQRELEQALGLLAQEPPENRRLRDLRILIGDPTMKDALGQVTGDGVRGRLLDGGASPLREHRFQTFELRKVSEQLPPRLFASFLQYLYHLVSRRLSRTRPTLVIGEELHKQLEFEAAADKFLEWVLTLRKENGTLLLVAHTAKQIDRLPRKDLLIESCPVKFFLPNANAAEKGTRPYFEQLGLTGPEIETLAVGARKRDYYYHCPRGGRMIDLDLGPLALAFLTPPPDLEPEALGRLIDRLEDLHGARWPIAYLEGRGLTEEAHHLEEAFDRHAAPDAEDASGENVAHSSLGAGNGPSRPEAILES